MSETTPVSGLVIAEDLDILNTQAAFGQLADSIDTYCIPRFTSTTLRDAAITAPVEGMLCAIGNTVPALQRYTGSAWVYAEENIWSQPSADQSFSTATATNITGFTAPLEASATYLCRIVMTVDGTVTASAVDFRLAWTYSGTLNGNVLLLNAAGAVAATTSQIKNMDMIAGGTGTIPMGTSIGPEVAYPIIIVKTTTAGTWQFQGRQTAAGAEVVTLDASGTWASFRRIA